VLAVVDAGLGPALYEPTIVWNPPASPVDYHDMGITKQWPRLDFWEADTSAQGASCMVSGVLDYDCMDTIHTPPLDGEMTTQQAGTGGVRRHRSPSPGPTGRYRV
jgi:hypothetical protein